MNTENTELLAHSSRQLSGPMLPWALCAIFAHCTLLLVMRLPVLWPVRSTGPHSFTFSHSHFSPDALTTDTTALSLFLPACLHILCRPSAFSLSLSLILPSQSPFEFLYLILSFFAAGAVNDLLLFLLLLSVLYAAVGDAIAIAPFPLAFGASFAGGGGAFFIEKKNVEFYLNFPFD